ncbi:hypothetical protein ACM66B_000119 [Microbotryomycetes sp. NB124-2]
MASQQAADDDSRSTQQQQQQAEPEWVKTARFLDCDRIVPCSTCSKPILESAMSKHEQNCRLIRNGSSLGLRRGHQGGVSDTSQDSGSASEAARQQQPKLVLHFGDGGAAAAASSSSATPTTDTDPNRKKLTIKDPSAPSKPPKGQLDLDRQCGVITDKGVPCLRSLTCKTHPMGAKRSVPHRSQPFDVLLAEWQKANAHKLINREQKQQQQQQLLLAQQQQQQQQQLQMGAAAQSGSGINSIKLGGTSNATAIAHMTPEHAAAVATGAAALPRKERKKRKADQMTGSGANNSSSGGGQAKERRTKGTGAGAGGQDGGSSGGKKGLIIVGEYDDSNDQQVAGGNADGATIDDDLIDSDEEVEAVLRGISKSVGSGRGRPLTMFPGGGAGFSTLSMFHQRNLKLAKLREGLGGIFRPPAPPI